MPSSWSSSVTGTDAERPRRRFEFAAPSPPDRSRTLTELAACHAEERHVGAQIRAPGQQPPARDRLVVRVGEDRQQRTSVQVRGNRHPRSTRAQRKSRNARRATVRVETTRQRACIAASGSSTYETDPGLLADTPGNGDSGVVGMLHERMHRMDRYGADIGE